MNKHAFHSRSEFKVTKAKGGYGVVKQRLGQDSQLPFGYCALSLKPAVHPVASPSGHIYSKEAIYEYLITAKEKLAKERKLYEEQMERLEAEKRAALEKEKHAEIEGFVKTQEGLAVSVSQGKKRKAAEGNQVLERLAKRIDVKSKQEKEADLKFSSYWMYTPEAGEKRLKKPPKRPVSPQSGNPLKRKDLCPLDLEESKTEPGCFVCSVSKKVIKYQDVILLKNTGKVMTKAAFEEVAKRNHRCPVTNKPFKDSDVLQLKSGSSSFAAKGKVEATKYNPIAL